MKSPERIKRLTMQPPPRASGRSVGAATRVVTSAANQQKVE